MYGLSKDYIHPITGYAQGMVVLAGTSSEHPTLTGNLVHDPGPESSMEYKSWLASRIGSRAIS
jgi:hypothetical protein